VVAVSAATRPLVAGLAADLDGFDYGTPSGEGGQKRVTVNIDAVNDETLVHAVNNARGGVTE